jgi:hypothetical protein
VIERHPRPQARANTAAQITATTSTRRPKQNRGNSTWERPQPAAFEHSARRGRILWTSPAVTRTNRAAACPHGASRRPHAGHASSPDNRRCSTPTGSAPTLSNRPPPGAFERPFPVLVNVNGKGRWLSRSPEPIQPRSSP